MEIQHTDEWRKAVRDVAEAGSWMSGEIRHKSGLLAVQGLRALACGDFETADMLHTAIFEMRGVADEADALRQTLQGPSVDDLVASGRLQEAAELLGRLNLQENQGN